MGNTKDERSEAAPAPPKPIANPFLAAFLAWLVPGGGHAFLGRRGRGALFLVLVLAFAALGCGLDGHLYTLGTSQRFLQYIAAFAAWGLGLPYVFLHHVLGYQGDPGVGTYEYGSAFLITASLMNLLLILDAWDIARGIKT